MGKRIINPWTWQEKLSYAQAVEMKKTEGTLYCAGQAAVPLQEYFTTVDSKINFGKGTMPDYPVK